MRPSNLAVSHGPRRGGSDRPLRLYRPLGQWARRLLALPAFVAETLALVELSVASSPYSLARVNRRKSTERLMRSSRRWTVHIRAARRYLQRRVQTVCLRVRRTQTEQHAAERFGKGAQSRPGNSRCEIRFALVCPLQDVPTQFSMGARSMWSTTITSTGTFCACSRSPSVSWIAVNRVGTFSVSGPG